MAAITRQWWRCKGRYRVFEVLCDPYLSASEASFSQWGAIQIFLLYDGCGYFLKGSDKKVSAEHF